MKVAHLVWKFNNGGLENMLTDIIRYQSEDADVHLIVIADSYSDSLIRRVKDHCTVYFLHRPPGSRNPIYLLRLNWLLKKIKPDVIHYHGDMYRMVRIFAKARVLTAHNLGWGERIISGVDCCVGISEAVYESLESSNIKNIKRIDNGIDFKSIKKRSHKPSGTFKMVQVGRLVSETKGQDIAIEALSKLVENGMTDISLTLIGDGESREVLKEMVKSLKLEDHVEFLGDCEREYIYSHLADYDLFLLPSRWEGFGLTVAEAIAARVPVVVAEHDGPMQIIGNGTYGSYFESGNPHSLATKIREIRKNYPDGKYLTKAANFVKGKYGVDKTAAQYIKLYKSLLNR